MTYKRLCGAEVGGAVTLCARDHGHEGVHMTLEQMFFRRDDLCARDHGHEGDHMTLEQMLSERDDVWRKKVESMARAAFLALNEKERVVFRKRFGLEAQKDLDRWAEEKEDVLKGGANGEEGKALLALPYLPEAVRRGQAGEGVCLSRLPEGVGEEVRDEDLSSNRVDGVGRREDAPDRGGQMEQALPREVADERSRAR